MKRLTISILLFLFANVARCQEAPLRPEMSCSLEIKPLKSGTARGDGTAEFFIEPRLSLLYKPWLLDPSSPQKFLKIPVMIFSDDHFALAGEAWDLIKMTDPDGQDIGCYVVEPTMLDSYLLIPRRRISCDLGGFSIFVKKPGAYTLTVHVKLEDSEHKLYDSTVSSSFVIAELPMPSKNLNSFRSEVRQ